MHCTRQIVAALAALTATAGANTAFGYELHRKSGSVTIASLQDYERCESDGLEDACLRGLQAYLKKHAPENFQAAKQVRLHYNHWVALPMFATALEKPVYPERCADEDLGLSIVSGLALPTDDPNALLAIKLADTRCWDQVRERIGRELKEGAGYFRGNACPLLKQKGVSAPECEPAKPAAPAAPTPPLAAKLKGLDPRKIALDGASAAQFRGPSGEQVLTVHAKGQPELVLFKWKGVRGPWNDQVLLAFERDRGHGSLNYVALVDDADWVVMTLREGAYEVYPKGYSDGIHVYRAALAEERKPLSSADVLKEFPGGASSAAR